MKTGNRVLAMLLAVLMLLCCAPVISFGASIVATGEAGQSITWTLYDDGTMIFDGKGVMYDYGIFSTGVEQEIKTVKINSGITYVGGGIFEHNNSIESVIIADSVERISKSAFLNCGSLKEVRMPSSLKRIEEELFKSCSSLTKIEIPTSVEYIGPNAFKGCTSLSSIAIPESVKKIDYSAFQNCMNLKTVGMTEGLETIDNYAFEQCEHLRSIRVPSTTKRIGAGAFSSCFVLDVIDIPGEDVSIGKDAFLNTAYYDFADNWEQGVLYIGKHLIKVKSVPSQSYTIKNGTKTIADYAFTTGTTIDYDSTTGRYTKNYNLMSELDIPDSVIRIGSRAFNYCQDLKKIRFPANLKFIAGDALGSNNKYTENTAWFLEKPDGCIYVGKVLVGYKVAIGHEGMPKNTLITVEPGTIGISDGAFSEFKNLTAVSLPDSLEYIGSEAFRETGLSKISFPNSLKHIGENAFSDTKITDVVIPDSVVEIGANAFSGWVVKSSLRTVRIGSGVKRIGEFAFDGGSIEKIYVSPNNPYFSSDDTGCLYNKDKTILYRYPCSSAIEYFALPDGVREIKTASFSYTNFLNAVWLPASIRVIEESSFYRMGEEYPKFATYRVYYPDSKEAFYTNVLATSAFYYCDAPLFPSKSLAEFLSTESSSDDPIDEPSTEPATQPATEPASDPAGGPGTEPTTEPATEPTPHTHTPGKTVIPAKIGKAGSVITMCETCGEILSGTAIPAIKTVKLSKTKYTYDAKKKAPAVTVLNSQGEKLKAGTDYTVQYSSGRKAVGTYKVKVTFKGNYAGSKTLSFKIVLGKVTGLKVAAGKQYAQLKWTPVKGATNYAVYYATKQNGKFKKAFTTRGATAKVQKLKTGKTYYFCVRAVAKIQKGTFYGAASAVKKVKIK